MVVCEAVVIMGKGSSLIRINRVHKIRTCHLDVNRT